nr:MAG TPA: hypothetical protein [Caudoviricetes sp.]
MSEKRGRPGVLFFRLVYLFKIHVCCFLLIQQSYAEACPARKS